MSKFLSSRKNIFTIRKFKPIHRFASNDPSCPKPILELKCKVAVITGGASGIGFATAHRFLMEKAKSVALIGNNNCEGREAVNSLNCAHGKNKSIFINTDVKCKIKLKDAFKKVLEEFGRIDVVVNSAGIFNGEHWEDEIATNLVGTVNTALAAYGIMCKTKGGNGGVLINISGSHGVTPFPAAPTLSACFHGIIGLSRSFGSEVNFNRTGVRVVTLCPGITHTDFIKDAEMRGINECFGQGLALELCEAQKQKRDPCGEAAIHLMKYGQTGSVWVVEGSKLYMLKIPKWKCYSVLASQYI